MGKRQRKKAGGWRAFGVGMGLTLGLYLAGILLLALFAVKGWVPEGAAFPVTAALCFLAVLGGGAAAVFGGVPMSPLPAAMLHTGLFVLVLLMVGLGLRSDGIDWTGHGGVLLLCAMAGGVSAGLLGGRRGRKRRRR